MEEDKCLWVKDEKLSYLDIPLPKWFTEKIEKIK